MEKSKFSSVDAPVEFNADAEAETVSKDAAASSGPPKAASPKSQ